MDVFNITALFHAENQITGSLVCASLTPQQIQNAISHIHKNVSLVIKNIRFKASTVFKGCTQNAQISTDA